jgi:hypothetical protein
MSHDPTTADDAPDAETDASNDLAETDYPDDLEQPESVETAEAYIKTDPLVRLFGDHAQARFLAVLVSAAPRSLNPSTLADSAGLSRTAWYDAREELLESGLVEQDGHAGNSPLYRIVSPETDRRAEWLAKLRDWGGAFYRDGSRPE